MNPAEFETIVQSEGDHWWFRGMRNILFGMLDPVASKHVAARVLEAGSGTGYMANLLEERYGWRMFVTDLAWEGLAKTPKNAGLIPIQADITASPFCDGVFDALISLDVLIHLKVGEEIRAIEEFARVLRPGGLLVVRVAALKVLRSRHSEFIEERQRFTRRRLVREISASGFRILRCTYANSFLLPVALAKFRFWEPLIPHGPRSGTQPVGRWLNQFLYLPLAMEAILLSRGLNLPLGQSLILLAQKGSSKQENENEQALTPGCPAPDGDPNGD